MSLPDRQPFWITKLMTTPHCWLRLLLLASLPFASAFGHNSNDPIDVPAGTDLLEASGLIHLELPEDFFAPGSSPYEGDVPAAGVQVETAGPFELGTTSLILERLTAITLPYPAIGPQRCIVDANRLLCLWQWPHSRHSRWRHPEMVGHGSDALRNHCVWPLRHHSNERI